jgi:protein-tyrosine phosphatase
MNLSKITDTLFIGDTPHRDEYDTLRDLGVRLVINMRFEKRPARDLHQPPLHFLWLPTVDSPLLLIPTHLLVRGVQVALQTIKDGGKVYAHCAAGRHRGVAMGAAILIALGYDPDDAIELIKASRPNADPDAYYIRSRIHHFAHAWQTID